MFGAYGKIIFTPAYIKIWDEIILIHALEYFPPTCYGGALHAHINMTTFTQFGQNWSTGCLVALYGSTMHPGRGFQTIFFFLLGVWASWKIDLKTNKNCMHWNVIPDALPGSATIRPLAYGMIHTCTNLCAGPPPKKHDGDGSATRISHDDGSSSSQCEFAKLTTILCDRIWDKGPYRAFSEFLLEP